MYRLGFADRHDRQVTRAVPIEAPVAIEVGGIGYAVMMATPVDLVDYATGFALAEGLVSAVSEIASIACHQTNGGWVVRLDLPPEGVKKALARARTRVSESSCGLCGLDSIEQVLRPLPPVTNALQVSRVAISAALARLSAHQPLSRATGAVHAAAFCTPAGEIVAVREDVGRHNALDKLVGALRRDGRDPAQGFFLLTARCSYELVEKTVRAGCPMLVTISAPTSLAVERAKQAGLTLVTLAREDSALLASGREHVELTGNGVSLNGSVTG
jgi:FdhD protein